MRDTSSVFGRQLSPTEEHERQDIRDAEIKRLQKELEAANKQIERLKDALGPNHLLTINDNRYGGIF